MTTQADTIMVGRIYTDGRGLFREVLAVGDFPSENPNQRDRDCLTYRAFRWDPETRTMRPFRTNAHYGHKDARATRARFADWAKREAFWTEIAAVHAATHAKEGTGEQR